VTDSASLPPDFYCPNPGVDCPGKGADLEEIREEVLDEQGRALGAIVFMACRLCGYRWDRS
jgi:hypothetical protein